MPNACHAVLAGGRGKGADRGCEAKAEDDLASCSRTSGARVFAKEPPRGVGALGHFEKAFVNDGACPAGQIKEIIGGKPGVSRQVRCVPC